MIRRHPLIRRAVTLASAFGLAVLLSGCVIVPVGPYHHHYWW
jgi:hypothetical protein